MAKKRYKKTISRAKDVIREWSIDAGYTMISDSVFSMYFAIDEKEFAIKNAIYEILMKALRLSKKKVNSLISVLETRGRVYILFKKRFAD